MATKVKATISKDRVTKTTNYVETKDKDKVVIVTTESETKDSVKISRNAKGDVQFDVSVYRVDVTEASSDAKAAFRQLEKDFPVE